MKRVVSFYEKLPRGPAPEIKASGFWGKYQAKHFGKNPTAKRTSPRNPRYQQKPYEEGMMLDGNIAERGKC